MPLFRKIKIFTGTSDHSVEGVSDFAAQGNGARVKGDDDVEALKPKRRPSDEFELYQLGS